MPKYLLKLIVGVTFASLSSCVYADKKVQANTCDPSTEKCLFETGVTVAFDDSHSSLLKDQDVMDVFGSLFVYWYNVNYRLCVGEEDDYFEELVFDIDESTNKKSKKRGNGKGLCRRGSCPKQVSTGIPNKNRKLDSFTQKKFLRKAFNSLSDPCDIGLLKYIQDSNPQYFADVTDVSVDIAQEGQTYTIVPEGRTQSPTPSPTKSSATEIIWDQVGQDIEGDVSETIGMDMEFSSDGTKIVTLGVLALKIFERSQEKMSNNWKLVSRFSPDSATAFFKLALSRDGLTFAVTILDIAESCENIIGSVKVMTQNSESTWVQKGSLIQSTISPCGYFGYSIAISDTGTKIAVGDYTHTSAHLYVYDTKPTTSPTQSPTVGREPTTSPILTPTTSVTSTNIPTQSPTTGGTIVWCRTSTSLKRLISTWTTKFARAKSRTTADGDWISPLTISNETMPELTSSYFGISLALTGDGSKIIVGAPGFGTLAFGAAIVFDTSDGSVIQQIDGGIFLGMFGWGVAASNDGDRIVVSSYMDSTSISVYDFVGGAGAGYYSQVGTKIYVGSETNAMKLSSDGNRLVIGSHFNSENGDNAGKAFVYSVDDDKTNLVGTFVGKEDGSMFGLGVALSKDGGTAAFGAPYLDGRAGYVQVFDSSIV